MDTEARAARATQRLKAVTYKLNDTERALATTVSEATNAQDQFTETVDQTEEAVASLQSATERAEQLREAAAAQDKRLRELLRLTQEQEAQLDEIAEETKTKKNAAKVGIRGRVGLCGGRGSPCLLACLFIVNRRHRPVSPTCRRPPHLCKASCARPVQCWPRCRPSWRLPNEGEIRFARVRVQSNPSHPRADAVPLPGLPPCKPTV